MGSSILVICLFILTAVAAAAASGFFILILFFYCISRLCVDDMLADSLSLSWVSQLNTHLFPHFFCFFIIYYYHLVNIASGVVYCARRQVSTKEETVSF
jgi:hypothetical protein